MLIKNYLEKKIKQQINSYVIKVTVRYTIFLLLIGGLLYFLNFSLWEKSLIFMLIYFSVFFYIVGWYVINIYKISVKKKVRTLLEIPWGKMESYEKEFYIKLEKNLPLIFIIGLEGTILLLIFIFLWQWSPYIP